MSKKRAFLTGILALLTKGAKISILQCQYPSDTFWCWNLRGFLSSLVLIRNQCSDLSNFCGADRDPQILRCFQILRKTRSSQCWWVSVRGICINPAFQGPGRGPASLEIRCKVCYAALIKAARKHEGALKNRVTLVWVRTVVTVTHLVCSGWGMTEGSPRGCLYGRSYLFLDKH